MGAENIFAGGTGTRKVAIKWVSLKSIGTYPMRTLLIVLLIPIAGDILSGLLSDLLLSHAREALAPPVPIPYCWQLVAPAQPPAEVDQVQK
jgi:hypothetical protein